MKDYMNFSSTKKPTDNNNCHRDKYEDMKIEIMLESDGDKI